MLAAYNSDLYDIVKVLHILCAIIGFGGVIFNGLYGAKATARGGREAAAIAHAMFRVTKVAEYFIYAVFVLGLALVGLGDNLFDFGQTWIWLSIVLFVAALGAVHGARASARRRSSAYALATKSAAPSAVVSSSSTSP